MPQAAAFFPVYPAVVHALTWVTGSELVAGVLISLAAGAVAAWVLAQLARPLLGERGAHDVVLYFALYPVGFVFTSLYSEGLFIALAAGSFLAATRGRPLLAGVLGGFATGTRLMGLALLPALVILLWRGRDPRSLARLAPLLLLPAAVGLYALYLDWAIGDAWAFTSAQADWNRNTSLLGPLEGLKDAAQSAGRGLRHLFDMPAGGPGNEQRVGLWNLSHLALLIGALWLTWVSWLRLGAAFGAYSAAMLVIALCRAGRRVPARQPPPLPARRLPALPGARLADARPAARTRRGPDHVRRARRGRRGGVRARDLDRVSRSGPGEAESRRPWSTPFPTFEARGAPRRSSPPASRRSSSSRS